MEIKDLRKKTSVQNFSHGRLGWTPGLITLHIAEGSFIGTCDWFSNPKVRASAHYVVGLEGEIAQCVDISDTAYVNGTVTKNPDDDRYFKKATNPIVKQRCTNANNYSIGIEFAGRYDKAAGKCPMTEKQKQAAIELISSIILEVKKRWGNSIPVDRTRICGHYEVNPITKPFCGKGFPYDDIIKGVISKLN